MHCAAQSPSAIHGIRSWQGAAGCAGIVSAEFPSEFIQEAVAGLCNLHFHIFIHNQFSMESFLWQSNQVHIEE